MGYFQTSKKEQKKEQDQLNKDAQEFNKELGDLLNKYKLSLVPAIQASRSGIVPVIDIARRKEEAK